VLHRGAALVLQLAEKVHGLQQGLPSLGALKRDGVQQRGQKPAHTVVAFDAFGVIVVVGRPRQPFPFSASLQETLTGHARKGLGPYRPGLDLLIQQDW
jgi:hypothetical protein